MGNANKRFFFYDAHVGKRGQIVIPKDLRDIFDINPGDSLVIVADKVKGIGLFKQEQARELAEILMGIDDFTKKAVAKKGKAAKK